MHLVRVRVRVRVRVGVIVVRRYRAQADNATEGNPQPEAAPGKG